MQYAEALKVHDGDSIKIRLTTGVRVTFPRVPLSLGVVFVDLYSVERCRVLHLDSRYDLGLGTPCSLRHEL